MLITCSSSNSPNKWKQSCSWWPFIANDLLPFLEPLNWLLLYVLWIKVLNDRHEGKSPNYFEISSILFWLSLCHSVIVKYKKKSWSVYSNIIPVQLHVLIHDVCWATIYSVVPRTNHSWRRMKQIKTCYRELVKGGYVTKIFCASICICTNPDCTNPDCLFY